MCLTERFILRIHDENCFLGCDLHKKDMFSKNSNSLDCSRSSKLNRKSDNTATARTDGTSCSRARVLSMSPSCIPRAFFMLSWTEFSLTKLCFYASTWKLGYMSYKHVENHSWDKVSPLNTGDEARRHSRRTRSKHSLRLPPFGLQACVWSVRGSAEQEERGDKPISHCVHHTTSESDQTPDQK